MGRRGDARSCRPVGTSVEMVRYGFAGMGMSLAADVFCEPPLPTADVGAPPAVDMPEAALEPPPVVDAAEKRARELRLSGTRTGSRVRGSPQRSMRPWPIAWAGIGCGIRATWLSVVRWTRGRRSRLFLPMSSGCGGVRANDIPDGALNVSIFLSPPIFHSTGTAAHR